MFARDCVLKVGNPAGRAGGNRCGHTHPCKFDAGARWSCRGFPPGKIPLAFRALVMGALQWPSGEQQTREASARAEGVKAAGRASDTNNHTVSTAGRRRGQAMDLGPAHPTALSRLMCPSTSFPWWSCGLDGGLDAKLLDGRGTRPGSHGPHPSGLAVPCSQKGHRGRVANRLFSSRRRRRRRRHKPSARDDIETMSATRHITHPPPHGNIFRRGTR